MINVLIAEDDPMVASINKKYINLMGGFNVVGTATNIDEIKGMINKKRIELMLLDVYMPGGNGLEILKDIRRSGYKMDIIMVTADSNGIDIDEALRYGVVDYLIKPFEFSRFKSALIYYRNRFEIAKKSRIISQDTLDSIIKGKNIYLEEKKGFDKRTIDNVLNSIKQLNRFVSAEDIARAANISRVTAKKYLEYMEEQGMLQSQIQYGGTGRPSTIYFITD